VVVVVMGEGKMVEGKERGRDKRTADLKSRQGMEWEARGEGGL
jgi:hypothetical protein